MTPLQSKNRTTNTPPMTNAVTIFRASGKSIYRLQTSLVQVASWNAIFKFVDIQDIRSQYNSKEQINQLTDDDYDITQRREISILVWKFWGVIVRNRKGKKKRTRNHKIVTIENFLIQIRSTSCPNVITMS